MNNRFRILTIIFVAIFLSCIRREASPQIFRDHASISYTDSGGEGTTLLFVHGLFIDKTYWEDQVKYFSQDYRVVTIDLPGHGESGTDRPHWTLQGYAGDVYTVIKTLKLENVILIGHSMGGDINLMTATYRPKNIIGFIGIDNFKDVTTPLPKAQQKQAEEFIGLLKADFRGTLGRFARERLMSVETPADVQERVMKSVWEAEEKMGLELMPQLIEVHAERARLMQQLPLKIHLINVDNAATDKIGLKKHASMGFDLREVHGTSHYPMIENPKEFNAVLRAVIEQISRETDTVKIAAHL